MLLFGFNGRATRNFLILLVSMHYILFIDRVNLAAAAPVMQQDLGLSNLALGLAFSAFNYSYAPFQLVGGWFADRFGARRTLTVCGLAWSLSGGKQVDDLLDGFVGAVGRRFRFNRQALVHAAADAGILRGTESLHDSPLTGFEPPVPACARRVRRVLAG